MQVAVRSRVNTGVALVGAGAIALTPIAQPMPSIAELQARAVSSTEVALSTAVNPIELWTQVLTTTFDNLSALGQQVISDPAPILAQIIANQIGYATTTSTALASVGESFVTALTALPTAFSQAAEQLAAGQISAGLNTAFQAILSLLTSPGFALLSTPILTIPGQIMENVTNVVKLGPDILVGTGFSALFTVTGVESAFGDTAQAVYDGVQAGNFGAALNAIVNAPAVLTDAFLNGYAPTGSFGILSPGNGLVPVLAIAVRDAIAQQLGAPVPSAAAAVESPDAAAALSTPEARLTSVSALASGTGNTNTVALKTEPDVEAVAGETSATSVTPPADSMPDAAGSTTETSTTPSTEAATDDATGSEEASAGSNPRKVVRDSVNAIAGKAGTKSSNPGAGVTKAINSVREHLKSSLNKIGGGPNNGLKNGFGKPAKASKSGSNGGGSSE